MTPLERAARAITETLRRHGVEMHPEDIRGLAVDALTAIREPNEAMERAMIGITGDMAIMKRDGSSYRHADVYRAMIDAALAE
jgi:hypothetical protein